MYAKVANGLRKKTAKYRTAVVMHTQTIDNTTSIINIICMYLCTLHRSFVYTVVIADYHCKKG